MAMQHNGEAGAIVGSGRRHGQRTELGSPLSDARPSTRSKYACASGMVAAGCRVRAAFVVRMRTCRESHTSASKAAPGRCQAK